MPEEEYDHWRYHYPKDREDADTHRGVYNLIDAQADPAPLVKEESAVYSEEDVIEILKLYKEKHK